MRAWDADCLEETEDSRGEEQEVILGSSEGAEGLR